MDMFGLGKEENSKASDFDLEKRLKSGPEGVKELNDKADARIKRLEDTLRGGVEDKEEYARMDILLRGYQALKKVAAKAAKKD